MGLISEDRYQKFLEKVEKINKSKEILDTTHMGMKPDFVSYMHSLGYVDYKGGPRASEILRRPEVTIDELIKYVELHSLNEEEKEQLEIMVKYEGYIEKAKKDAQKLNKLEEVKIPAGMNYLKMDGLRLEARQKFDKIQPRTIGQASRISGVNPSDISVLLLHIKKGSAK